MLNNWLIFLGLGVTAATALIIGNRADSGKASGYTSSYSPTGYNTTIGSSSLGLGSGNLGQTMTNVGADVIDTAKGAYNAATGALGAATNVATTTFNSATSSLGRGLDTMSGYNPSQTFSYGQQQYPTYGGKRTKRSKRSKKETKRSKK